MIEKIQTFLNETIYPFVTNNLIVILLAILGTYVLSKILEIAIERAVRKVIKGDPHLNPNAEKKREDTIIGILTGTMKIILWVLAILVALSEFGVNIGPLIAGAGILGVAVGFGGQYLVRDLVTGIFILMENQYRVGDVVQINDAIGTVEKITLRLTTLRDLDGVVYHIPHGSITVVSNMAKGFSRVNIDLGISYESNVDEVIKIVNQVGEDLAKDEQFKDKIISAPKCLGVNDLADSSVILKIVGDTQTAEQWLVGRELRRRIKNELDSKGISIPFPQVELNYKQKNEEAGK